MLLVSIDNTCLRTLFPVRRLQLGQCICNPKSGIKRNNHVCLPYRQLAMSFLRMDQEPFAPMLITDTLLSCTLTPKIAADVRFHLELVLSQRNFAALWQDETLLRWMRTHCIFCGALHTAADLAIHVREAHLKGQTTMIFYMEQLMPVITALQQVDHQCALCMQIYNLPVALSPPDSTDTRASVAQSHLKGCCPNLLQVALLLARLLHGSGLPYGPAGRDGTDAGAGNVSGHCPPVGQVPETGIESQGQQAPAQKRLKRTRHSKGRGLRVRSTAGAPSETPGAADRSSRSRTQQSSQDGSIHHFFGSRTDRGSAASSAVIGSMEAADGVLDASAGLDASAPVSGPRTAEGSPETLESADGMPGHGPIVSDLSLEGGDSPGSQFPLPSLGCTGQATDLGQEEVGAGGQDGSTHRRAPGDDDRWPSNSEISCIEAAIGAGSPDHSVAPPAPHTVGQTVRADAAVGVQLHLDVGGGLHEATHTGTEPVGDHVAETPLSEAGQGKGPRQGEDCLVALTLADISSFSRRMCGLQLANDHNWCYANSTILCLLWTLLSLHPVNLTSWGARSNDLFAFLSRADPLAIALAQEAWFSQILQMWGNTLGQQDSAEFSQAVLAWLNSPAINMRWERRCEVESTVHVMDHSAAHIPIKLEFTLAMDSHGFCTLTDLVNIWCQVDSMSAAPTWAPPCLCFQLDRFMQADDGTIWRTNCSVDLDSAVTVPVFVSSGLCTKSVEYAVVAGACHLGADLAGHYRALLKLRPGLTSDSFPYQWMLTDDSCRPEPVWHVPGWMRANVTVLWLIRVDCLQLCTYTTPAPLSGTEHSADASLEDSNALLTLLHSQDGVTGGFHDASAGQ